MNKQKMTILGHTILPDYLAGRKLVKDKKEKLKLLCKKRITSLKKDEKIKIEFELVINEKRN